MNKLCNTCNIEKPHFDYRLVKNKPYYQCRICERNYDRNKRPPKTEEQRLAIVAWRKLNKEKLNEKNRQKYADNLEISRKIGREKQAQPKNKQKQKQWYAANVDKINKYYRDKRANDPLYRLSANIRSRTKAAFIKGSFTKNSSLSQYLGCTMPEFKIYIEAQFQTGMTWDNYGDVHGWVLDHTLPLFGAKSEQQMYSLCHYTNIKPMWYYINSMKRNRTPEEWLAYKLANGIDESTPAPI